MTVLDVHFHYKVDMMMNLLLLVALVPSAVLCQDLEARSLGFFTVEYPAYTSVIDLADTPGLYDLFVTTFETQPNTTDEVYAVRDLAARLDNVSAITTELVSDEILYPNEINLVPVEVFGTPDVLWLASGFLVPTKNDGAVHLLSLQYGVPATTVFVTDDPVPWFFHRADFLDMNGDGLIDIVSARCNVTNHALMWYEHPSEGDPHKQIWKSHHIVDGPDIAFRIHELPVPDGSTRTAIISTQYFTQLLTVTWTEDENGLWNDPSKIYQRVIDKDRGHYFDLELSSWFYRIFTDFDRRSAFPSSDYLKSIPGSKPSYVKPEIILSGDDDGNVYLFTAEDDKDPSNWNYAYASIFAAEGIVGSVSVKDVDGDNYEELFIPAYSQNELHIMTFAP
ncbi:uncharacterized protein LOC144349987 [Saccoglossus kowalevskii]